MVKIKDLRYNLNHIYRIGGYNRIINIGESLVTTQEVLQLFEKSLALTSDLKRLPVLRGIAGGFEFHPNIGARMLASGVAHYSYKLVVYNGDRIADNIIMTYFGDITQTAGVINVIEKPFITWDYEGGILAFDQINIDLEVNSDVVVVGTSFTLQTIKFSLLFEIDWVAISKNELEEYILENVYAKQ